MAHAIASCAHVLLGGYDFSADFAEIGINYGSESKDATTMGQGTRINKGGLKTAEFSGAGYLNLTASGNESILFGNVGVDATIVTVFPHGINAGSTVESGYGMGTVEPSLGLGNNIGELLPFSLGAISAGTLVKSIPIGNALSTALTTEAASQTQTAYNLGHAATSEQLFGGWHVTALTTGFAATVSAIIQAASSSGFPVATTRMSFTALSTKGAAMPTAIQPSALSTDMPWYRAVFTVSTGTSTGASANALLWMAVQ